MENPGLLGDTKFWIMLSTVAFGAVAYVKGRKPILDLLDARTARIKAELTEAERLREEAQDLLCATQRQHREALQTAQRIIESAKETAERVEKDSIRKLEEQQKRREAQLMERISRAEATAVAELRQQAARLASAAAEDLLRDASSKNGATLINEAIAEIPNRLN